MIRGRKPNMRVVGGKDASGGGAGDGSGTKGGGDRRLDPPSYLDRTAKQEWRRLVPLLTERRIYIDAFETQMAVYCQAFSRWRKAEAKLREKGEDGEAIGEVVMSPKGYPMLSPWLTISKQAAEQMRQLGDVFGLTPVAQVRLQGAQLDLFDTPATPKPTGTDGGDANPFGRF